MSRFVKLALAALIVGNVPLLAGENHKARQARPIPLGVSGGNASELGAGRCCSGTLGALVQDRAGTKYILSNAHVLAGKHITETPRKDARERDAIHQPGGADVRCRHIPRDQIGHLVRWEPLKPGGVSLMDAAIAEVAPQTVDPKGRILEIGTIAATPAQSYVGQKVKKSGRTTGLTRGTIKAVNATIRVSYSKDAKGKSFKSTFKNQILVTPGHFIKPGDSGSLLVEDVEHNPRPIGLLFAGGSSVAIANPIQKVLQRLDVTFVGSVPAAGREAAAAQLDQPEADADEVAAITAVKEQHASELMQLPGVIGLAVGFSSEEGSSPVIFILVEATPQSLPSLAPKELDGVPVEILEIGEVVAY